MQYLSPFPGFSKTQILERREEELRHALKSPEQRAKILKAAERLRSAKLHLSKALHFALVEKRLTDPSMGEQALENLKQEAEFWKNVSPEDIVERYRNPRA